MGKVFAGAWAAERHSRWGASLVQRRGGVTQPAASHSAAWTNLIKAPQTWVQRIEENECHCVTSPRGSNTSVTGTNPCELNAHAPASGGGIAVVSGVWVGGSGSGVAGHIWERAAILQKSIPQPQPH